MPLDAKSAKNSSGFFLPCPVDGGVVGGVFGGGVVGGTCGGGS
jgi:hypothetical protein